MFTKFLRITICSVLLFGLNAHTISKSYPENHLRTGQTIRRYALLVGINKYQNVKNLRGCVNDIEMMQSLLLGRGFLKEDVSLLPDKMATKSAIKNALKSIIDKAKKDDVIVFHYSGHGSQVKDDLQGEEIDNLDETLIPYDYIHSKSQARKTSITDDEINILLKQLTQKNVNLTVIVDACHSGGISRDALDEENEEGDLERYIEIVDKPEKIDENIIDNDNGLKDLNAKYVLITGSKSNQKSRETKIGSQYFGILSQALFSELNSGDRVQVWPDIMKSVIDRVEKINYNQTPQLEGENADSFVFGETTKLDKKFIYVSPTKSQNIVDVEAGNVLGISVGSVFKVYGNRTTNFAPENVMASIEIVSTGIMNSKAKILDGTVVDRNSKAVESKHNYGNMTLAMAYKGDWKGLEISKVKTSIEKIESTIEDTTNPTIILNRKKDSLEIAIAGSPPQIVSKLALKDPSLADKVAGEVRTWRKWFHVFRLSNSQSASKVSMEITKKSSNAIGDKKISNLLDSDFEFTDQDEVMFTLTNLTNHDLYINIVDLKDNGSISTYTLGRMLGQLDNEPLKGHRKVSFSIKFSTRKGSSFNLDVMKIFATTADMTLNFLELDEPDTDKLNFQKLVERDFDPVRSQVNLDDWDTIQKVIRVKNK